MMKKEIKLHILFILSAIASAIIANLVEGKAISKNWITLAWIMILIMFGIGTYGYITYTIPRYRKIGDWFKRVITDFPSKKQDNSADEDRKRREIKPHPEKSEKPDLFDYLNGSVI